ncbi:MAG: hypothetical protein GF364_18100 [Candidatus Lokiarchaeota archaeon]|nr:hypothetical protein [Candidatus Lokiarchaeota archaeon]
MSEEHEHHKHDIMELRQVSKKRLILSLVVTLVFMIVEIVGGIIVNSISLINDAGHMFTHCFSIGIALVGMKIAEKPACSHKTFGLYRA